MKKTLEDFYPEIDLREALCKQVAIYKLSNLSKKHVTERMGFTSRQIDAIWDSIEVTHYIRHISETTVRDFKTVLISEVAKLVPLMVDTLKEHLENKNLLAIPHALKIMGFDKETTEQNTSITVVMPDTKDTTTIEYHAPRPDTSIHEELQKNISSKEQGYDVLLPSLASPVSNEDT